MGRDSVEPLSCGRLCHRWFWFFLSFLPFWISEFYFGRIPGICVIVAYRPKPRKEDEVLALVRSRVPNLRKEGLVTDRQPVIMRSRDGTIIDVSEWKSREGIDAAHKNPNVLAMWTKFSLSVTAFP